MLQQHAEDDRDGLGRVAAGVVGDAEVGKCGELRLGVAAECVHEFGERYRRAATKLERQLLALPRELADGSGLHQLAMVENGAVGADLLHVGQLVARDQHRGARRLTGDNLLDVEGAARVETGGRFVEQQHLGVTDERRRDAHPLGHAVRELGAPLGGRVGEAHLCQHTGGFGVGGAVVHAHEAGIVGELRCDGHLGGEPGILGQHRHPAAEGVEVAHLHAQDAGRTAAGPEDGGEDAEGGGLARAVGAQQAVDGTARYLEREGVHGALVAVELGERVDADGGVGVAHRSRLRRRRSASA